ncbi:16399_t:CDS:2 [Rhizophagus irregularis]|nr:16399_t:CDS:2 [Rhizophagus irregularis]
MAFLTANNKNVSLRDVDNTFYKIKALHISLLNTEDTIDYLKYDYGLKEGSAASLAKFAKECKTQTEKSVPQTNPLKEIEFYDVVEFRIQILEDCSLKSQGINSEANLNIAIDRINEKMSLLLEHKKEEYQQITQNSDNEKNDEEEKKNTDKVRSSDNVIDTIDTTNTFNQFQEELDNYINKSTPTEGKYTCSICNKNLVSDKTLTRYITEQHTNKRYRCN